ncbi:hypothetical protein ACFPIJ_54090, partial [Dactylosporangium cerinum]
MSVHRAVVDADFGEPVRQLRNPYDPRCGEQAWDDSLERVDVGWNADYAPAPEQLRRQRSRLLALVGQRLRAGWVGWDPARDRWQPVIPVVLEFDGGVQ